MEAEKGFRILVVDGDAEMRGTTVRLLAASGYEVLEAESGEQALGVARESLPDLVLVDRVLPDMTGIEFCRRFTADPELQEVHIVVLSTGRNDSETQARYLDAGAEDFISRPVTNQELLARIRTQRRLKETRDRLQRELSARKAAETRLRQQQEIFRLITESLDEVFWVSSPGLAETVYVSPSYEKLWGRPCESLYRNPRSFLESVHPDDKEKAAAAFAGQAQEVFPGCEYRIIRPDGSVRWIFHRGSLICDDQGDPCLLVGIAGDITSRKELQDHEKLLESEVRLRDLAENLHQALWLRDRDRILYVNPAFERIFGGKREEYCAEGHSFLEAVHPDDRERVRLGMEYAFTPGGVDEEYRVVRPDGEVRWVKAHSFPVWRDLETVRVVGVAEDITIQKEALDLLIRENAFRTAVISQAKDGVCVCHEVPDYPYVRFSIWNEAMTRITGYSLQEINRLGWYQTLYPDPHVQSQAVDRMRRMREGEDLVSEEWEITHADGSPRIVRISSSILDLGGEVPYVMAVIQDFTTRRRTEQALRESEERYRTFIEYSSEGICRLEGDPIPLGGTEDEILETFLRHVVVAECNEAYARMHGKEVTGMLGTPVSELIDISNPEYLAAVRRFIQSGYRIHAEEFRVIGPDGESRWFLFNAFGIIVDGCWTRTWVVQRDISQRKRAQAALDEYRERLELAMDAAGLGMYDLDLQSRRFTANERYWEMLGYETGGFDATFEAWEALVHPSDREECLRIFQQNLDGLIPVARGEYRLKHRSGSWVWVLDQGRVVARDEAGNALRFVGCHMDITARKESEEALQARERELHESREHYRELSYRLITAIEEERRKIARELHDDITQRMAALAVDSGLLLQCEPDLTTRLVEPLKTLNQQAARLAEDVHGLSRQLHPSLVEDFGVVEAVRAECLKFQQRRGIVVRFRARSLPEEIKGHVAVCLYRVVQESLRNIDRHAQAGKVQVSLSGGKDCLHLSIEDDGVGFHPTELRGKRGMGLASMRERVSLVDGTMTVRSKPGRGTQIKVRVPLQNILPS